MLQLRSILNEPTPGEMEDALEDLSENLTEAFGDNISRIKSLPKSRAQLGMDVLMWLCHAKRVMSTAELSDALAFRRSRGSNLEKYRPSLNMMLECCHGLAVLSADSRHIELAHYSIQEYLESHSQDLFPSLEEEIASTCIGYLMLDEFKWGPQFIDRGYHLIVGRILESPFVSYAAHFWDKHIRNIQVVEAVWPLLTDFLYDNGAIASSIQVGRFERGFRSIYVDPSECLSRTPIHNASEYGLERHLRIMLEKPDSLSIINSGTQVVGSTPIIMAASSGHIDIIRLLLQHGADPTIANWYGNALHCAAEADRPEAIAEFVGFGMSPNDCDKNKGHGSCKPPLLCVLDRDGVSSLKVLIGLGASIREAEDWHRRPYLHQAAMLRASKIVEYLVLNDLADVNCKSRTGQTALDCAIALPSTETVRTLIRVGADLKQISPRSSAKLAKLGFSI